jgi:hypothetical protein
LPFADEISIPQAAGLLSENELMIKGQSYVIDPMPRNRASFW